MGTDVTTSPGSEPTFSSPMLTAPGAVDRLSPYAATWLSLLFVASRVGIFLFLAGRGTDLNVQEGYVWQILGGRVPFRDFFPEYPPLVFAFTGIPALFDHSLQLYSPIFRACCCAVDCGIWATVLRINRARVAPCLVYVLGTTALGPVLYDRIDIVLGALLLAAIAATRSGRPRVGALAIGAGIAFKIIPIVWAPAILAAEGRRGARRLAWAAMLLVLPAVISLDTVAAFGGYRFGALIDYHSLRGIQLESGPASVEMLLMRGPEDAIVTYEFGSFNLHTRFEPLLIRCAAALTGLLVLGSPGMAWRRDMGRQNLALLLGAVLCGAMALSKVLSPQYIVFLLPVLVALPSPVRKRAAIANWILVLAIALLTGAIFPWEYDRLIQLRLDAELLVILRNGCLAGLCISLLYRSRLLKTWRQGRRINHREHRERRDRREEAVNRR